MVTLLGALWATQIAWAQPAADFIQSLPDLGNTSFAMYSGYLSWGGSSKHFHYWLTESQGNPATDPIVLWLNGGPGCSSMDGLLQEQGPVLINDEGQPYLNPYSWNQYANMLYLESPAGVGFSYSDNPQDYYTGDSQTAIDNWNALQTFFTLFPNFQKNDFFIVGESYGGIYVPTLSYEIQKQNAAGNGLHLNLKAFGVGNGLASDQNNDNSLLFFANYHALFSQTFWQDLRRECCRGGLNDQDCNFHDPTPLSPCWIHVEQAQQIIYNSGLNYYSLYANCTNTPSSNSDPRYSRDLDRLFKKFDFSLGSRLAKEASLLQAEKLNKAKTEASIKFGGDVPCINSYGITTYLNRADVQAAIHVNQNLPWQWTICSNVLHYNRSSSEDVIPLYNQLLTTYRALVYNGDTDMACNYLGDMWAVDSLGRQLQTAYRPWHDNTGQVAGFLEAYDQVTFMTIKGAGHMVPQDRPVQALMMFKAFLDNELLP